MDSANRVVKLVYENGGLDRILKTALFCREEVEAMYQIPDLGTEQQVFVQFTTQDLARRAIQQSTSLETVNLFNVNETSDLRKEYLSICKQENLLDITKMQLHDLPRAILSSARRRHSLLIPVATDQCDSASGCLSSNIRTSKPIANQPADPLPAPDKVSSKLSLQQLSDPGYTVATHIGLSLHGEKFSLDLASLDTAPDGVVELLKTTRCPSGTWMTVAAYYRREGKPKSAIGVLKAMLRTVDELEISEVHLKPIYLMLSGCNTDLAKFAKVDKSVADDEADKHYRLARNWLQKVYGKQDSAHSNLVQRISRAPAKVGRVTVSSPTKVTPRTQNKENPPPAPLLSPYKSSPSVQTGRAPYSRERFLEREIETLREHNRKSSISLEDLRDCKRQLEDDLAFEREKRRKLEYELEITERERDEARRMEDYALEEARREALARHRAEDRIALHLSPSRGLYRDGR